MHSGFFGALCTLNYNSPFNNVLSFNVNCKIKGINYKIIFIAIVSLHVTHTLNNSYAPQFLQDHRCM